jgi:hypothetical protein
MPAPVRKRRLYLAGPVIVAALLVPGPASTAGTSTNPEITDVAGDGNFINGQGAQPGHEVGPDTRPASSDNLDLRAVWFETDYSTTKVRDAAGKVLRVQHHPTALLIHVQTQAPARPMTPWSTINYKVSATLPGCQALFQLDVFSTIPPERAMIWPAGGTSCDPSNAFAQSPVPPTFDGTVSTMTFPLSNSLISSYISTGTAIRQPKADAFGQLPSVGSGGLRADETVTGRDFTIGQDVPADIDCVDDPENPQCEA